MECFYFKLQLGNLFLLKIEIDCLREGMEEYINFISIFIFNFLDVLRATYDSAFPLMF